MSVGAFRLALSATANVAVEDAVLSSEIPSFSCSKVPEKIGFGFGVRDFHFSTVALEFRASPVAQAEYAVDDFSDEGKSSGKKVGGDKDEGLEISKLRIALEIVSALAKSGITNLFPIQDSGGNVSSALSWWTLFSAQKVGSIIFWVSLQNKRPSGKKAVLPQAFRRWAT